VPPAFRQRVRQKTGSMNREKIDIEIAGTKKTACIAAGRMRECRSSNDLVQTGIICFPD
jgi:hypothetical protein